MGKAVLILDEMPTECANCSLVFFNVLTPVCAITGCEALYDRKPKGCPLHEAPEPWIDTIGGSVEALGYNMALEDLGVYNDGNR